MKLMTISEVTKTFNVTTRMLRYYDEIGLLPSTRKQNYAYRVYDELCGSLYKMGDFREWQLLDVLFALTHGLLSFSHKKASYDFLFYHRKLILQTFLHTLKKTPLHDSTLL
ncbi:MAG: MerR family transcriptional regulator [Caulobacteraceae bacterium]